MKIPTIDEVIAAARAGEAAALALVRAWLPAPEAQVGQVGQGVPGREDKQTPARVLQVVTGGFLVDVASELPQHRREVFAPVPPFGHDDPLLQGLEPLTRAACQAVRACPPLAHRLQRAAAAHLWALERRLYLEDTLQAAGRQRLERELRQLLALGRPLWQNWLHATPAWRHDQFDALVREWLDEPIDWDEQRWFAPDWRRRPRGLAEAGALVASLDDRVRQYLGVQLVRLEVGRWRIQGAKLAAGTDAASGWAECIGLPWRFEPVHDAAAQDKGKAAAAAAPARATAD